MHKTVTSTVWDKEEPKKNASQRSGRKIKKKTMGNSDVFKKHTQ